MMLAAALLVTAQLASALSLNDRGACDCSFHLSTTGNVNFPVGEDSEGEVLAGSKLSQASFCLNGKTIVDSKGNPCWFTPPTYVFQCDVGATPATPFSIGNGGVLSYSGSSTFYECQNGIGDEVNIYSKPDEGAMCGSISLIADSCRPPPTCSAPTVTVTVTSVWVSSVSFCPTPAPPPPPPPPPPSSTTTTTPAPPPPPPPTTTTTPAPPPPTTTTTPKHKPTTTTTSSQSQSTCPLTLPANFQFPHLIVPINSSHPNTTYGTSYFGTVSSTVSSIFNFDIPASDSGASCTLWFSLPTQAELVTSSFTLSGSGALSFASLRSPATGSTSYANAPGVVSDLGQFTVVPGNAYSVATFTCPAGQTVAYKISSGGGGTSLSFFQDYNPCAIGLYIIPS